MLNKPYSKGNLSSLKTIRNTFTASPRKSSILCFLSRYVRSFQPLRFCWHAIAYDIFIWTEQNQEGFEKRNLRWFWQWQVTMSKLPRAIWRQCTTHKVGSTSLYKGTDHNVVLSCSPTNETIEWMHPTGIRRVAPRLTGLYLGCRTDNNKSHVETWSSQQTYSGHSFIWFGEVVPDTDLIRTRVWSHTSVWNGRMDAVV